MNGKPKKLGGVITVDLFRLLGSPLLKWEIVVTVDLFKLPGGPVSRRWTCSVCRLDFVDEEVWSCSKILKR
jgi:hypothetical protein